LIPLGLNDWILGRPAAYVACTTKWREATVTSQLSLPNLNNDVRFGQFQV
jgi:hypothetical protein